jgi:superfamily I DNA/RNA helicase
LAAKDELDNSLPLFQIKFIAADLLFGEGDQFWVVGNDAQAIVKWNASLVKYDEAWTVAVDSGFEIMPRYSKVQGYLAQAQAIVGGNPPPPGPGL